MDSEIVKIVYFDEGSATDYIQIRNGGSLIFELQGENNSSKEGSLDGSGKVGIGTKLSNLLFRASADVEGSIGASFKNDTVMKSVLTSTVLTDFLRAVEDTSEENRQIMTFEDKQIEQIPGSISSMYLVTPYLSMLRNGQTVEAGDLDISLDKLDSALSKAKGYFEFLGKENGSKDIVFRFNGNAFKNNYRPSNLLRMDLKLYAVPVGKCHLGDFAADKELSLQGYIGVDNPDYAPDNDSKEVLEEPLIDMYDVILAGVRTHG